MPSDLIQRQRAHLHATAEWAARARDELGGVLAANGHRVHFRPASTGVAMIGLLPERPQRGKSGFRNLARLARDFEQLFAAHCCDVPQGRITGEKALQSFLIRDAYAHGRRMNALNAASSLAGEPADLMFVTDEIPVPTDAGRMVCDILAVRGEGGPWTPAVIELKDDRLMKRLVEQVEGYAALVDAHLEAFSRLYSAVLGESVVLAGPCEKWIVWPLANDGRDPRELVLGQRGIRVVAYRPREGGYELRCGRSFSDAEKDSLGD